MSAATMPGKSSAQAFGTRWLLRCCAIVFASVAVTAGAQTLDQIGVTHQANLDESIQRLNAQRETIQAAQIPLAEEWNELQREIQVLRSSVRELQAVRDSRSLSLEALENRINDRQRVNDFIVRALSGDFVSAYETFLGIGEMKTEGELIRNYNRFLEGADVTEMQKLERLFALIESSADRIENVIGGRRYSGQALNEAGQLVDGQFVQIGPLSYFADASGEHAGWIMESPTLQPQIYPLPGAMGESIVQVVRSGQGDLPVDPTLGDAVAVRETRETWGEKLGKGGIWVYPIIFFALISTVVVIIKSAQIFLMVRQLNPLAVPKVVRLLREGKKDEAKQFAEAQSKPGNELLKVGVEHADEPVELVEESLHETLLGIQPRLERFVNLIAVTAATAPLLGLLGTVTGIIKTFKLMQHFGAGDPKPLITGISEALITTELGLILAIPALILHALLSRRISGVMGHMERISLEFVNRLERGRSQLAEAGTDK